MTNPYYPHLFAKGKIGSVTLKNRIVRNSMGTYLGIRTALLPAGRTRPMRKPPRGGPDRKSWITVFRYR